MGIQKFKHSIHHISEKEITKKLFYEKFTEEEYNKWISSQNTLKNTLTLK